VTWVVAHRGASRDCPENTLAAFDAALAQGCDGIELDVQLSRDGVPVVFHDRTLHRAGGGRRRVGALDLADLQRLEAGARAGPRFRHERIPTLERVLDRYGRRTRLLIEIKARRLDGGHGRHAELARKTIGLVRRHKLRGGVFLLCFDPAVLDACAGAAPEIPRVLNVKPGRTLPRWVARRLPSLAALSADVHTLTPGFAAAVRRAGTPLFAYTCNSAGDVRRALDACALAMMSDRPGWLATLLRPPEAAT